MQQYSIVISIFGWSAKNINTGRTLFGEFEDLPATISKELSKLIVPSTNSLCVASTVTIPHDNEFNRWFLQQPKYTYK